MPNTVGSKQILKDLHAVLVDAKQRFTDEFIVQEVKLNDTFKVAFRNHLIKKNCSVEYLEHTTIVTNKFGQNIFIANQWFVIASYFVDFCSEMISYRELFVKTCHSLGMNNKTMKEYATMLKSLPTVEERTRYLFAAIRVLKENFPKIEDDYNKVAVYLWKFASDYEWWAGNKTVDRGDFYISALLNQMNVVNANSEYLAIIALAYASDWQLRLLVEDTDNFTIDVMKRKVTKIKPSQIYNIPNVEHFTGEIVPDSHFSSGISISAASLERFKSKGQG